MNINSYDIETYEDENCCLIPYCVSFYYKNIVYSYYNDNVIIKSLEFIFKNMIGDYEIFYIHNIKFDGSLIIRELSNHSFFKISAIIENGKIYLVTISYNKKKIDFRCSYKLLPLSLNSISIGFSIKTLKMDFPYSFINKNTLFWKDKIERKFFKTDDGYNEYMKIMDIEKYTIIYCENDCYITKSFVEEIWRIFNDEFKIDIIKKNILSAPSLSFYTFYNKFNIKKVDKYLDREKELFIRDSYFGGRCEVFGNPINDKYIYHYDYPGMYGLCMKEKNVCGKSKMYYDIKVDDILKPGFYSIKWESNMFIPVLPHHSVTSNKLLFTNGVGFGTYWFEEIELFRKMGGIVKDIKCGLIYDDYDYISKDFVEYFEKFRERNYEYKTLGKLMINSFYGRTGLSIKEDVSFFVNSKEDYERIRKYDDNNEIKINDIQEINNIYLISVKIGPNSRKILSNEKIFVKDGKILNIAIASSVTAKARVKLYNAFEEVKKNKGRILYCDTDSVFAEFGTNVLDRQMGDIFFDSRKDDTIIKDCVFTSPKSYGLKLDNKELVKIKGITRDSMSFNQIKQNFYDNKQFIAENIKQLRFKNFEIRAHILEKRINFFGYDKRFFSEDLKYTYPFLYNDGQYEKNYSYIDEGAYRGND